MPRQLTPCGTRAAYRRHLRRGETPCDACREAENAAHRVPGGGPRRPARHGSQSKYKAGCRCPDCLRAHREACAAWREAVAGLPEVFVPHGVNGYGNYGCRCETCTAANSEYCRQYRARRADRTTST